jgi:hypothetical protein
MGMIVYCESDGKFYAYRETWTPLVEVPVWAMQAQDYLTWWDQAGGAQFDGMLQSTSKLESQVGLREGIIDWTLTGRAIVHEDKINAAISSIDSIQGMVDQEVKTTSDVRFNSLALTQPLSHTQLSGIGTLSHAQIDTALGLLNQDVKTTASPTFAGATVNGGDIVFRPTTSSHFPYIQWPSNDGTNNKNAYITCSKWGINLIYGGIYPTSGNLIMDANTKGARLTVGGGDMAVECSDTAGGIPAQMLLITSASNPAASSPPAYGAVVVQPTVDSSSSSTGALIVRGGAGIAKTLRVGGSAIVSGQLFSFLDTDSISPTTGAVTLTGGMGIGGSIFGEKNITIKGALKVGTPPGGVNSTDINTGIGVFDGGVGITKRLNVGESITVNGGSALNAFYQSQVSLGMKGIFGSANVTSMFDTYFTRIGKHVTVTTYPSGNAWQMSSEGIITSGAIPSQFRPTVTRTCYVLVTYSGTGIVGRAEVATSGIMTITPWATGSKFPDTVVNSPDPASGSGITMGTTFSYFI